MLDRGRWTCYLQVSLGPLFPELVPERRPVFDAQHAGAERPGELAGRRTGRTVAADDSRRGRRPVGRVAHTGHRGRGGDAQRAELEHGAAGVGRAAAAGTVRGRRGRRDGRRLHRRGRGGGRDDCGERLAAPRGPGGRVPTRRPQR